MLDALLSMVVAVGVALPGFVAGELTRRDRAVAAYGDGQSTLLQALFYAVLIHLVWSWRSWTLGQELSGPQWQPYLGGLVVWVLLVVVVSPVMLGLSINYLLRHAEEKGSLSWWHSALGGQDARDAWDFAFQQAASKGAWVLVSLKDGSAQCPRMLLGKYGERSASGQTPAEHDLFLQELWSVDESGQPVEALDPPSALWVSKTEISAIYFPEHPGGDKVGRT